MYLTKCRNSELDQLKYTLSYFKFDFQQKQAAANYKHDRFLKNNNQWLKNSINFPIWYTENRPIRELGESSDGTKLTNPEDVRAKVPMKESCCSNESSR